MNEITMKILNNDVKLDVRCCYCGHEWCQNKNGVCEYCKGTNFMLTEVGQAIIDLVNRHINKKEV